MLTYYCCAVNHAFLLLRVRKVLSTLQKKTFQFNIYNVDSRVTHSIHKLKYKPATE